MGTGQVGSRLADLPAKIRAFIAIRVGREVERAIEDLIDELRSLNDGINWVSQANLHLTLKFLGPSVPGEKIRRLEPGLETIAAATNAFEIEIAGVGGFPNLKHPNVLWVGLRSGELSALAARVDEVSTEAGFEREQRPFRAHLTIARLKHPLHPETRARIEAASMRNFGISNITEMILYRSTTASAGPLYEALHEFRFRSGAALRSSS